MKTKIVSKYIITIFALLLVIILFVSNITEVKASYDFDFSMDNERQELILKAGETKGVNIFVNSTNFISKKVNLSGNWIGDKQPSNILANFNLSSGLTPFSSNIIFSTTNQSELGHFKYNITAFNDGKIKYAYIEIIITYNITISIKTDKETYQNGEKIHVYGNISKTHQTNTIDYVNINFENNGWKRSAITSIRNNSFEYYYNVSYGDPGGIWNITTRITDIEGIVFSNESKITVVPPPDILRYNVLIYSPPENAVYYRGNTINISVYITEAGVGVNDALTSCILSIDNIANLTEISNGYYQGSYKIPWDSELGFWSISIECIKKSESSLTVGGSFTFLEVKPATINLELLNPSENNYFIDDSISIIANLSYPDGAIIEDADVIAKTPSCEVGLIDQQNGTYLSKYLISNKDLGSWFMDIYAIDKFGNSAFTSKTIQVSETEKFNIPFSTIFGILFFSLIASLIAYLLKRNFSAQRLTDIEEEIQEEELIQNETVVKYFKTGSISRNTYDSLMKQHTERLGELKKEKSKIKKWRKN